MIPIVINIILDSESKTIPIISLKPKVSSRTQTNTLHNGTENYFLNSFQKDALITQINNLVTNAIHQNNSFSISDLELNNRNISIADKQWIRKVDRIIDSEISNSKFTVDNLAYVLNVSRSKVHRRIKQITGLTPNKYIRSIKLQAARNILENGNAQTVSEVCYAVGFDTPKYFSKIYEQRFGKRPISCIRSI